MAVRVPRTRERLASFADLTREEARSADELLAEAELLGPSSAQALVHGDFHVRHVLVAGGGVSAVIDWGDVCVGDPSIDLQLAWALLPEDATHGVPRRLRPRRRRDAAACARSRGLASARCSATTRARRGCRGSSARRAPGSRARSWS